MTWLIVGVLLGTCVIRLFIIEAKLDRLLREANSQPHPQQDNSIT